jgi:hypothetical protein
MKRVLINYADRHFYRSQQLNARSGIAIGGFDSAITYGRKHLDPDFCARNKSILDHAKGAGFNAAARDG